MGGSLQSTPKHRLKEEAVGVLPLGLLDFETTNLKWLSSCVSSVNKSTKGP